jgi:hypothetical protein
MTRAIELNEETGALYLTVSSVEENQRARALQARDYVYQD